MIINCTQCGASINPNEAEISKAFIKCPSCGYWEDLPTHNVSAVNCPNCEASQAADSTFCSKCGSMIHPSQMIEITYCEKCGTQYESSEKYCKHDGLELSKKIVELQDHIKNHCEDPVKPEVLKVEENVRGFGFAYFWVITQSLGTIFWIAFSIYLMNDAEEPMLLILSIFSIPSALTAYGIYSRRKWGLYVTYLYLVIFAIWGVIKFLPSNPILGLGQLTLALFWYNYFNKRANYFGESPLKENEELFSFRTKTVVTGDSRFKHDNSLRGSTIVSTERKSLLHLNNKRARFFALGGIIIVGVIIIFLTIYS